ncbi:MAG: sulfatase/phosphatase domain-containing protein, partial [Bacteroidota bacterium]
IIGTRRPESYTSRFCLRVPMIIRFPEAQLAGTRDDQLISFIDFAPTVMSLAGIPPPNHLDGQAFLGAFKADQARQYIHAAADRFDAQYDRVRAVRDGRYKYIRYYEPEKPMFLPVRYREQMAIMQELHRLDSLGQLNPIQQQWFRATKPQEELFDTQADPHEVQNLAKEPQLAEQLKSLRTECERWINKTKDKGAIAEKTYLEQIWPNGKQPQTAEPLLSKEGLYTQLSCSTQGASIGYQLLPDSIQQSDLWRVYIDPITIPPGFHLNAMAHRLGYLPSEIVAE